MLTTARPYLIRREPGELSNRELASRVYWYARCAASAVDPDEWFPIAEDAAKAREQAADALAVCAACPVRADCLELALRHGSGFGAYGVWGGLVEAERLSLRGKWLAGATVRDVIRRCAVDGNMPTLP